MFIQALHQLIKGHEKKCGILYLIDDIVTSRVTYISWSYICHIQIKSDK